MRTEQCAVKNEDGIVKAILDDNVDDNVESGWTVPNLVVIWQNIKEKKKK